MLVLRDYQNELIDSVYKSMNNKNKKILIQSAAGSGKSVTMSEIARRATVKKNHVLFVVHRKELVFQIKDTFNANEVDSDYCHVGMVQTVYNQLKKDKVKEPSIILVDESHHSLAKTYQELFNYFPNAFVLGFTATPVLLSGRGLGEVYEDIIIGKSVKWLIENERLAPFKYYSVDLLDDKKLKHNSTGDFSHSSITDAVGGVVYGDVVNHYKELADGKKTIVYCHNIEASKKIAKEFSEAGYNATQVDGKTNKNVRKKAMEDFRTGDVTLLVNAELYGEGVDVPDCEAVILLRPTESLSLFIQQTMRAMRYKEGKTAIIIDHVANYTRHGLPTTEHEWTLKGRKKQDKTIGPPCMTCTSCGQVIEKEEIMNNVCPRCGVVIIEEQGSQEKEMTFEEATMKLLTEQEVENNMMAKRKYKKRDSLSKNYEISKAKAAKDKKNALYKLFGAMVAYNGKKYTEAELQEFADNENISINSVNKAYNWASCTKEKNAKKEPFWKQSNFY